MDSDAPALSLMVCELGKSVELHIYYDDADHAFFNDDRPEVYNAADAADAWLRTLDFFRKPL